MSAASALAAAPEVPPCVLFVDDEAAILSSLRRLLRSQGYRVLLAESGAAGLEILAQESVDVVVSDMRMPQMDGAQFLECVRQRRPGVQRLLLTGYADIASTIAAINRGEIHRYIAKPWDDQELLLALREAVARRRLERENERLVSLTREQNTMLTQANATLEQRVQARTAEIEQINSMLEASYAELEQNFLLSLDVFAGLLELRERGAAGQSRAVAVLAKGMAQRLNLTRTEVQDVHAAALLHGVGRMSLPDSLISKPVSLMTPEELARWRRHPLAGESALMPLASLQRAARLVRMQLERVNGQGFPDGLSGAEIPVAAQVVGAAVEYHDLIAGRLSERKPTDTEARQRIAGRTDAHFRAEVIQALMDELARPTRPPEAATQHRSIEAVDLRPGMVLARDLLSPRGTLLLAAGYRFDEKVVRQIHDYVQREGVRLTLDVCEDDLEMA